MPEGLEAEIWRRAAEPLIGRVVADVWVDERVAPLGVRETLVGAEIVVVDRVGKVVVIGVRSDAAPARLGLHFGMTGRLVVDGVAPIERLEYASSADRAEWDRLRLWTDDPDAPDNVCSSTPALRMNDPRRLGRVTIDPDLSRLGPDAFTLTADELAATIGTRRVALKTALLDQGAVAGLGNLCADEVMYWAGVAPARRCDELERRELVALARACRDRLPVMMRRGGSTSGVLGPEQRRITGTCPRDGAQLDRTRIGGRTTIWCPEHQR